MATTQKPLPPKQYALLFLSAPTVVANVGTWMYNAASGWLMTSLDAKPMARTQVSEDQFQVKENEVIHLPTDARWTACAGRPEPHLYSQGMVGSVLPNGEDYRREDVEPIAIKLLAARPGASGE
ncbi:hypothetical protein XI09_16150 [Bradyrhizobium sp. CCBAU 11386]|uniref:MFS transporter n=1 Tax=Bradyrhizobium sp. CCBAU 11386 TaxID=1630837 RepID=UPI00230377A2|nr:MFS transporter [Bradyrhizobium sp. CCBAU 11386]MDA9506137.1 hypothetical protein [Bradyrhizobium sp. CCBAU 11386]